MCFPTNMTPTVIASKVVITLGTTNAGAAADSLLVLLSTCFSRHPLDVASIAGSIVAVFFWCGWTVVGNVCVLCGVDSENALSVRKTRAKPGAGTWT